MSDVVVVALIAAVVSALGSIGAMVVGLHNGKRVDDLHVLINSNLSEQIAASVRAALLEGRASGLANGITQERERRAEDRRAGGA